MKAVSLAKATIKDFLEDNCTSLAAALSYYTIFSLPPLLILILILVGTFVEPADVQKALHSQFAGMMGSAGADQMQTIIQLGKRPGGEKGIGAIVGIVTLLIGATGAFLQLQQSLNRVWEVQPDPGRGGVRNFIMKRLLSFGMLLGIAFLLLVSLVVTAVLSKVSDYLGALGGVSGVLLTVLSSIGSLAIIALLFTLMFKYLPDALVEWGDARVGGIATALLFEIGRFLLGFYFGRSDPGSAFGAAGSLALILVWIYYSGIIVLLGAEFTQAWAEQHGRFIEPKEGAVRVIEARQQLPETDRAA